MAFTELTVANPSGGYQNHIHKSQISLTIALDFNRMLLL